MSPLHMCQAVLVWLVVGGWDARMKWMSSTISQSFVFLFSSESEFGCIIIFHSRMIY